MKTILILSGLFFSLIANGFEFTPMEREFAASGSQATQTFFLENKSANPVAIELNMYKRSHDTSGRETRTVTNDFFIFPKSVKLSGNEKRAVRVTWQGPGTVSTELAYRLVAEQLNVNVDRLPTDRKGVDIRYIMTYVASVYVSPDKGKSEVRVSSVDAHNGVIKVRLDNLGNKHRILAGAKLVLNSSSGTSRVFSGNDVAPIQKMNLLAKSTQYFLIRQPSNFRNPKSGEIRF